MVYDIDNSDRNQPEGNLGITIGVVTETYPGERRVAIVPRALDVLTKDKVSFLIQRGAGEASGFPDAEYEAKGARLAATREEVFSNAQLIAQVRTHGANPVEGAADLPLINAAHTLIGFSEPLTAGAEMSAVAARGATLFAMELMPRITRAQSMDALSSMATITGYKAVLLAADYLPRMFPMLMTAAGTIAPAKVFVLGAGVAGLQAIATARRLGAVVSAYDVRPAVKEQIESLGAKFMLMDADTATAEDKGGYAKAMDEEFYRRQRDFLTAIVRQQDVVITTAAVPGRKAPVLITTDMVRLMAPGSVVVDIAAERGGNCEATRPGENILEGGVTVMGPLNLASTIPYHASQMYARNVVTFIKHLAPAGELVVNTEDEITRETLVTRQGQVVHARVRSLLGLE